MLRLQQKVFQEPMVPLFSTRERKSIVLFEPGCFLSSIDLGVTVHGCSRVSMGLGPLPVFFGLHILKLS